MKFDPRVTWANNPLARIRVCLHKMTQLSRMSDVCRNIRNVKLNEFLFSNMRFIVMFVTVVCVLFLIMSRFINENKTDKKLS